MISKGSNTLGSGVRELSEKAVVKFFKQRTGIIIHQMPGMNLVIFTYANNIEDNFRRSSCQVHFMQTENSSYLTPDHTEHGRAGIYKHVRTVSYRYHKIRKQTCNPLCNNTSPKPCTWVPTSHKELFT